MRIKRILSIILCIATLFSVLSLTAFAEEQEPYAAIKFRNPEKYNVAFGETEEIYLEYSTGGIEVSKIEWEVSKKHLCKIKYVTDEETGLVTGAILTGRNFGTLTITARLLDENGNEITSAKDILYIQPSDSENKTLTERFKIFMMNTNIATFMMMMFFVIPLVGSVILAPYNTIKAMIKAVGK